MASAPASLFITASNASMSATSMDNATRLESCTNVLIFVATPPNTSSLFGDASQCSRSSTSCVAISFGMTNSSSGHRQAALVSLSRAAEEWNSPVLSLREITGHPTKRVGQPWLDRQERTSAPDQEASQPQPSGQTPFNPRHCMQPGSPPHRPPLSSMGQLP